MIVDKNNYNQFCLEHFKNLPNEISIKEGNNKLNVKDFNLVTKSTEAQQAKNIIYIWRTRNGIPRLKGCSNIVYIGQTERSFFSRHGNSKIKAESEANSQKYNDIVNIYGPLSVSYIELEKFDSSTTLLKAEGQFLWWYFQNHSEYPPVNYTKTKIRNAEVEYGV